MPFLGSLWAGLSEDSDLLAGRIRMDRLSEILASKRRRVETAKQVMLSQRVFEMAQNVRAGSRNHALSRALQNRERTNIIAEFKRRSPAKGGINETADPVVTARAYESGGAAAISVLTESDHFAGSLDDLRAVNQATALPILRKDFIFDEYQIYETAATGADALLLIAAALDNATLARLRRIAEDDLHMDALVEVHTKEELARAVNCGARLIGINNRNLRNFWVSLETSIELATIAPADRVLVSESGIESLADIRRLRDVGYHGFLIGETLMRAADPIVAIQKLVEESTLLSSRSR